MDLMQDSNMEADVTFGRNVTLSLDLASRLGLEEATFVHILSTVLHYSSSQPQSNDEICHSADDGSDENADETDGTGRRIQLNKAAISALMPFWQPDDIDRVGASLVEQGVLTIESGLYQKSGSLTAIIHFDAINQCFRNHQTVQSIASPQISEQQISEPQISEAQEASIPAPSKPVQLKSEFKDKIRELHRQKSEHRESEQESEKVQESEEKVVVPVDEITPSVSNLSSLSSSTLQGNNSVQEESASCGQLDGVTVNECHVPEDGSIESNSIESNVVVESNLVADGTDKIEKVDGASRRNKVAVGDNLFDIDEDLLLNNKMLDPDVVESDFIQAIGEGSETKSTDQGAPDQRTPITQNWWPQSGSFRTIVRYGIPKSFAASQVALFVNENLSSSHLSDNWDAEFVSHVEGRWHEHQLSLDSTDESIIPSDWSPSDNTVATLINRDIPMAFLERMVGQFVERWELLGIAGSNWDDKFIHYVLLHNTCDAPSNGGADSDSNANNGGSSVDDRQSSRSSNRRSSDRRNSDRAGDIGSSLNMDSLQAQSKEPVEVEMLDNTGKIESVSPGEKKRAKSDKASSSVAAAAVDEETTIGCSDGPLPQDVPLQQQLDPESTIEPWQPSKDVWEILSQHHIARDYGANLLGEFEMYRRKNNILAEESDREYVNFIKERWSFEQRLAIENLPELLKTRVRNDNSKSKIVA